MTTLSGIITPSNILTASNTVTLTNKTIGDALKFADSDGSNYVALQAASVVATNVTWTLPDADGSNGDALLTNGSGELSWGPAGISTGKAIAMAIVFG